MAQALLANNCNIDFLAPHLLNSSKTDIEMLTDDPKGSNKAL